MYNELKVLLAELPVLHDITAALTLLPCDTTDASWCLQKPQFRFWTTVHYIVFTIYNIFCSYRNKMV